MGRKMEFSYFLRMTALLAGALLLSACGFQDAKTPVDYKPGVYQGQTDENLTEEQLKTLRERSNDAY